MFARFPAMGRMFMFHVLMANPTDDKPGSISDSDTEVDSSPDSSEDSGKDVDKLKGLSSQKGPPNFDQRKPWTPGANTDPLYLKLDSEGETISLYTRQPVHSTVHADQVLSVADEDTLHKLNINRAGEERANAGSQFGTLSCDDLTMDARACAKPVSRRKKQKAEKAKGDKIKKEKKKEKDTFDHFVETEDKVKSSSKQSNTDIEDLIKQLVLQQTSQRNEIVFFDAAIVYDKNDYEYVVAFREEIVQMVKSSLGEDVRIELFDSEVFAQSKIMVVQDVINRCSVVFLYLTENFNSPELQLFVEEGIGISRLQLGSFASSAETASKRWALKPVHTMPPKSRKYPTPLGLVSVHGIDWYDRHSEHTKSKIIAVMKAAIIERKQRSLTVNVQQRSAEMFGAFTHMPPLGPPFNIPITDPQRHLPAVPNKQDPMLSHHSVDALSFPLGYAGPPKSSVLSESIPLIHPSLTEFRPPHSFNSMEHQYRINQTGMQMNQVPYQYMRQGQAGLAYQLPVQTGIYQSAPYQSAGLQNQSSFQTFNPDLNQQLKYPPPTAGQQYPSYPNRQLDRTTASPLATYQGVQQYLGTQQNALLQSQQQSPNEPYHYQIPPFQQRRPHDPYLNQPLSNQNQPMSRDALQSESGNYLLDQRHDTPNRSQLRVVSRVNGQLIPNPDLSTDDVEIDNLTEVLGDTPHASKKSSLSKSESSHRSKKYRTEKKHAVKQDGSDDSDDSSNDSGYSTVIVKKKPVKEKVYNFVGCKIVQLGKGNKVTESSRKMRSAFPKSERPDLKEKEIEELSGDAGIRNRVESTADNEQSVTGARSKDATSTHKTSSENLLAVDVRKPALNKAIVLEETGSNSVHLSDSGNGNTRSQFNQLNSVAHSSEHEKSEEGRIFQMKMNFSLNDSYQQQDGAQSSIEDNRCTSEELNISDDRLFGSGSLDARNQTLHEDKIPCFTVKASRCSVQNKESEGTIEDKKACFAFETARRETLFSKISKFDNQQNLRSFNVCEDTDEVD